MTSTHVIILAQGKQTRLPNLKTHKHLLELPACGVDIITRTLCQLAMLSTFEHSEGHDYVQHMGVTVVCGGDLRYGIDAGGKADVLRHTGRVLLGLGTYELGRPGNSSLKGISRYLDTQDYRTDAIGRDERIVVLLGDVVYSWDCLRAILKGTHWNMGFVGSPDLSRDAGELYGLSWRGSAHGTMLELLDAALVNHPPFEAYQCGQMRRWLWEADRLCDPLYPENGLRRTWYVAIDDYTDDVDVPSEVAALPQLALEAAEDDKNNGLHWRGQ